MSAHALKFKKKINKGKNKNKNECGFYQRMKLRELENLSEKGLGFEGIKGGKREKEGAFFGFWFLGAEIASLEQRGD